MHEISQRKCGGKLVGIARSLTDFCYCCYLSDLAVDKEYQGTGIGKELIRQTQMQLIDFDKNGKPILFDNISDIYMIIGWNDLNNGKYKKEKIDLYHKEAFFR